MKKLIFIIGFFLIAAKANAEIFPFDTITYNVDNPSNGTTLLSAVNYPRSILYAHLSCRETTGDAHIRIGSSGSDYVIDQEINSEISIFTTETIASGTAVTFVEGATSHCQLQINYIPRLYASSTIATSSIINNYYYSTGLASTTSSTINFMSTSSIENIGYSAIETDLGNGRKQIEGQYNIPFALYFYIVTVLAGLIVVIYFFNKKK